MLKRIIVSAIPVLAIVSWLVISLFWPKDFSTNNTYIVLLLFLGVAYLIGLITAFFVNLIFPVATDWRSAIQIAKPSLFSYLLFFMIIYTAGFILDGDFKYLETIGFSIFGLCFVFIPTGLLLWVSVASFRWLGARIRMGSQSRPSL